MSVEDRKKLQYISREEFRAMQDLEESERPAALKAMRAKASIAKKKKRKAQRAARRKNR